MTATLSGAHAATASDASVAELLCGRLGAGRHQTRLATMSAILGGTVRVGLEDSIYLDKGHLAESNAEQVAKIVRVVHELLFEVASADEARAILSLKGRSHTGIPDMEPLDNG